MNSRNIVPTKQIVDAINKCDLRSELLELLTAEMDHENDDGKRIIANRLLEFLAPWQKPPAAPAKDDTSTDATTTPTLTFDLDDEVQEALGIAGEICALAGELPEEGAEFGESVTEKSADIARNIEAHNRVTDRQLDALQNMLDGLQRWFDY